MDQYIADDLEYVVEDYLDMVEYDNPFEDDAYDVDDDRQGEDDEFGFDDDFEDKQKTDTSASEVRKGKDIQGIPWERLNFTRDKYREMRLKQYKNYENLQRSREEIEKECIEVQTGSNFYDFRFNTRVVKSTIVHFQH